MKLLYHYFFNTKNEKKIFSFLYLLLFLIQPLYADTTIATPSPTPNPAATQMMKNCDDACIVYQAGQTTQTQTTCGSQPAAGSTDFPFKSSAGVLYQNYADCQSQIAKTYFEKSGQLATACTSKALIDKSKTLNMIAATVYTAAAAACGVACAAQFIPAAGIASLGVLSAACTVSGLGASATDLASTIMITNEGQSNQEVLNYAQGYGYATVGAGGLASALSGTVTFKKRDDIKKVFKKGSETARESVSEIAEESVSEIAEESISETAGESVPEGAAKDAKKTTGEKAMICASAVIFTAIAATKWVQTEKVFPDLAKTICSQVNQLAALGNYTAPTNYISGNSVSAGSSAAQVQSGQTKAQTGSTQTEATNLENTPLSSQASAAMAASDPLTQPLAGPLSHLLGALPPNALKSIGDALNGGESPSQAMSSAFPGLPTEVTNPVKKFEDLAKKGNLSIEGLNAIPTSAGGKSKDSSPQTPALISFASRLQNAQKALTEMTFNTSLEKLPQALLGSDILHENWHGTIFQLISLRLNVCKPKITFLEWETRLNRALTGLPKKK